jgi:hypothetical protein
MTIAKSALALAAALSLLTTANAAEARERRCAAGVEAVRAEGRVVWCAPRADMAVVTRVVWSRTRHAIAFATESRRGELTLEVVLIGGPADLHSVSWEIPERVQRMRGGGDPSVTWLGPRRVAFGYSEVRPAMVASWTGASSARQRLP